MSSTDEGERRNDGGASLALLPTTDPAAAASLSRARAVAPSGLSL